MFDQCAAKDRPNGSCYGCETGPRTDRSPPIALAERCANEGEARTENRRGQDPGLRLTETRDTCRCERNHARIARLHDFHKRPGAAVSTINHYCAFPPYSSSLRLIFLQWIQPRWNCL